MFAFRLRGTNDSRNIFARGALRNFDVHIRVLVIAKLISPCVCVCLPVCVFMCVGVCAPFPSPRYGYILQWRLIEY